VWQKAMGLTRDVYRATASFPKDEIFGLRGQIRRAAVSIPSNIAEGHGRLSDASMRVFLGHARGSAYELETQIQLSADLDYLEAEIAATLLQQCNEVSKMLNGLLKALREESNR
jgi:four helix bundle protein